MIDHDRGGSNEVETAARGYADTPGNEPETSRGAGQAGVQEIGGEPGGGAVGRSLRLGVDEAVVVELDGPGEG